MPDKLITRHAAAKLLGVGVRAVRRAAQTGELPVYRLGNQVRVRPEDAVCWLESCRRPRTVQMDEPELDEQGGPR